MPPCKELPCVVATFGVAQYPVPKKNEAKTEHLTLDNPEFMWLLAAYCFDAQRKLLYATKAALPMLEQADPELRQRAFEENEEINAAANWRERAAVAERLMLKLQRELSEDLRREEPPGPVGAQARQ